MPIIGITADVSDVSVRSELPIIVRLYKGSKKRPHTTKDGKEVEIYGEDLDYFRPEFTDLAPASIAPAWRALYGEQPTELHGLILLGATVNEAFPTWLEEWRGSRTCIHRCDGQTQVLHYGKRGYDTTPTPCVAPHCECQKAGRLTFILYDLMRRTGILGAIRIVTHSFHDILNIHDVLSRVENANGTLNGMAFRLWRAPDMISTPGKNGRALREKSLLYIRPDEGFEHMALPQGVVAALGDGTHPARQLPSGDGFSPHDTVDGEFDELPPLEDDAVQVPPLEWPGATILAVKQATGEHPNVIRERLDALAAAGEVTPDADPSDVLLVYRGEKSVVDALHNLPDLDDPEQPALLPDDGTPGTSTYDEGA